jgi:hypothetical protein
LTSPIFFAIMPKFERARVPVGAQFGEKQNDETRYQEAGSCPARGKQGTRWYGKTKHGK